MLFDFPGQAVNQKKKEKFCYNRAPASVYCILFYSGSYAAQAGLELRVTKDNLLPPPEGSTLSTQPE